jgi:hypothetical protein
MNSKKKLPFLRSVEMMYRSRLNKIKPQKNDKNKMVTELSKIKLKAKCEETIARMAVKSTDAPMLVCLMTSASGHLSRIFLLTPEQNNRKLDTFIVSINF